MSELVKPINVVPYRPTSREAVYAVIDGERDYQDAGEGNAKPHPENSRPNGALSPGEALLCIEEIAAHARASWYMPGGQYKMLPFMRKIAGVAVQALENYGAPPRAGHDPFDREDDAPSPRVPLPGEA